MKPASLWNSIGQVLKNEDWLSIVIATIFILLSVVGVLGSNGLKVVF